MNGKPVYTTKEVCEKLLILAVNLEKITGDSLADCLLKIVNNIVRD